MHITRLTPDDAARLRTVRLRALHDAPDAFGSTHEREVARSLADWADGITEVATFVAVVEGQDAGMVRSAEDHSDATSAWLISMWVAPEYRGEGIGDALITAVIEWSRAGGYRRVRLDVADQNAAAIALYARHGFEPTGEVSHLDPPRSHITEHRRVLELPS